MVQKPKIGKNSTHTNADPWCTIPMVITRQPIEPESCSNPLKTREVL